MKSTYVVWHDYDLMWWKDTMESVYLDWSISDEEALQIEDYLWIFTLEDPKRLSG